ncbi:phosphatidylserine decarboxylase-domain-containing protein [Coniella lustricola]|uniref:phosphatidylserine decarboxylase n=1 Tax=Coniella lustricola TaxID=2025994 RepID=A0A2T3ANK8_9PEZI|nr:phosphatidylserine decarboxylase-domain-containing protein [Coniella lustricola]
MTDTPEQAAHSRFASLHHAINAVTDKAKNSHTEDPQAHLQTPATHETSHAWMRHLFPYTSLEEVESAFHLANYVMDRKTGAKTLEAMPMYVRIGMHMLYYGSEQERLLSWDKTKALLKEQSEKMGREYDDPASVAHIQPFIESFELQGTLDQLKEPDVTKYKNFNEFFGRELRPDARPIDEPENGLVVSSVADCRLTTFPTVDLATKYWIKGYGFTLDKLLGDVGLAEYFEGGSLGIFRLAPQDYHRWHSPVDGVIESITDIPGTYYTVNPQAINEPGTMDVFCENKRSVMTIKWAATGSRVAVVAVGAMLVGSIKYNPGIEVGATVKRGQTLGAFYYGGSTVITVFKQGEVTFDEDLVRNSTESVCETVVSVGWRVGGHP